METYIKTMKKYLLLFTVGTLLAASAAVAEPPAYQFAIDPKTGMPVAVTNTLPRFNLEFPGGTPRELVKAIEKATDKPLSVIIPEENLDLKIPALSVKNVTVADLFAVLKQSSMKPERFILRNPLQPDHPDVFGYVSSYTFQTEGQPTEDSIWYFHWDRGDKHQPREGWNVVSSTVCRFYQLDPYLGAGYSVEDITTAVETGWKMLGVVKPPAITYHKDTKVLIAVGEDDKVDLIGELLKQLRIMPEKSATLPKPKNAP
jgi:hypothetical protein